MDKTSVCTKKRSTPHKSLSTENCDDDIDEESIQSHLSELVKELKRKTYGDNKVTRLLSLTFAARRNEMLSQPANSRMSFVLQKYRCLDRPVFVSWQ